MMHWFKILLIVVLIIGVSIEFYETGKGNYERESKAWAHFIGAICNGLILWGVIAYL